MLAPAEEHRLGAGTSGLRLAMFWRTATCFHPASQGRESLKQLSLLPGQQTATKNLSLRWGDPETLVLTMNPCKSSESHKRENAMYHISSPPRRHQGDLDMPAWCPYTKGEGRAVSDQWKCLHDRKLNINEKN